MQVNWKWIIWITGQLQNILIESPITKETVPRRESKDVIWEQRIGRYF